MCGHFKDKVALITGGTSGIGEAAAVAFARSGAKVVITGRREERGQEVVNEIHQAGGNGLFIKTDITQAGDVQRMVEETVLEFGRLDYAFNNAGIEDAMKPLPEQSEADYEKVFNTNVKGVFLSMKYQIPAMLKTGGGSIVNNSSIAGLVGLADISVYVASKHAVMGLTKAAALEWAKEGVRINAVCPAAIRTEMYDRFTDGDADQRFDALQPIGRIGTPEEVVSAVLWLCSNGASFMVGQGIAVDGGYTVA